jgi:hypothetical protein
MIPARPVLPSEGAQSGRLICPRGASPSPITSENVERSCSYIFGKSAIHVAWHGQWWRLRASGACSPLDAQSPSELIQRLNHAARTYQDAHQSSTVQAAFSSIQHMISHCARFHCAQDSKQLSMSPSLPRQQVLYSRVAGRRRIMSSYAGKASIPWQTSLQSGKRKLSSWSRS